MEPNQNESGVAAQVERVVGPVAEPIWCRDVTCGLLPRQWAVRSNGLRRKPHDRLLEPDKRLVGWHGSPPNILCRLICAGGIFALELLSRVNGSLLFRIQRAATISLDYCKAFVFIQDGFGGATRRFHMSELETSSNAQSGKDIVYWNNTAASTAEPNGSDQPGRPTDVEQNRSPEPASAASHGYRILYVSVAVAVNRSSAGEYLRLHS